MGGRGGLRFWVVLAWFGMGDFGARLKAKNGFGWCLIKKNNESNVLKVKQ